MIASRNDRARSARLLRGGLALAFASGLAGCAASGGMPMLHAIEPLPQSRAIVPDDADLAARDVAVAALSGDTANADRHLARLHQIDQISLEEGLPSSGLIPIATDLRNAGRNDHAAYVAGADELLERDDLDPALRTRLQQSVDDEPLRLAAARRSDARLNSIATVLNRLAEPIGRAAMSGVTAAAGVGRALLSLAVEKHLEDELSTPERQALVQEKRFLAERPDAPEAAAVAAKVEEDEVRLARTQRDRSLRIARRALDQGNPRAALIASDRALRFVPEDAEAMELRETAGKQLLAEQDEKSRSVDVASGGDVDAAPTDGSALAVALLAPNGDIAGEASRILARDLEGPLADEARFSRAIAWGEQGSETEMWSELTDLSKGEDDPDGPNMARHAGLLLTSPDSNPYGAFLAAQSKQRGDRASWLLLGPLANGARDRDLPRPVEWLIEVPTVLEMVTSLPTRIVRYPWLDANTFGRAPERHARTYLTRHPEGEYADGLREFLVGSEIDAGNAYTAWELAKDSETDPESLAELRERAARQVVDASKKTKRRDLRIHVLKQAAQEFPDTEAGHEAGNLVREEVSKATPQQVRVSRNYLQENPHVAGPDGFGIHPALWDGNRRNGELHPEGVVLAGGQLIELRYVAESGDEEDPPIVQRRQISGERLARIVALLEETSIRNELVDSDNTQEPDARRDLFFESARLGIAAEPDKRASAESTYVFKGMRERYGLVRGRESILPVDLVLQGSLPTLGLGAFPRLRPAKPTPDAILYK